MIHYHNLLMYYGCLPYKMALVMPGVRSRGTGHADLGCLVSISFLKRGLVLS